MLIYRYLTPIGEITRREAVELMTSDGVAAGIGLPMLDRQRHEAINGCGGIARSYRLYPADTTLPFAAGSIQTVIRS